MLNDSLKRFMLNESSIQSTCYVNTSIVSAKNYFMHLRRRIVRVFFLHI